MASGRFIPKNPNKYRGNVNQIMFRSSWELTVMKFFDSSNAVTLWNSEEIAVPYISPKDGRVHRYFPDFLFEMLNQQQKIERWLVEVKPLKETDIKFAKSTYDKIAIAVNEAKWKAAEKFCAVNGLKFKVITELDIYKMAPKKVKTVKPKIKPKAPKAKLQTARKAVGTRKTPAKRSPTGTKSTIRKK